MEDNMIDWLTKRAEQEAKNVAKMNMASIKAVGTSHEDFNDAQRSAQRSLGKMEMIDEIFKYYIASRVKSN